MRGALYDLSEAEAGGGGDRWEGLTEEERAEEERCDYERYLALYQDEFQYQAFQGKTTTPVSHIIHVICSSVSFHISCITPSTIYTVFAGALDASPHETHPCFTKMFSGK